MELTYLGQSFNVESTAPRLTPVAGPLTRTLQYKGNTYTCRMSVPQTTAPRAVNWRYEVQ